jgi:26S proteasome regulatory subunit N7
MVKEDQKMSDDGEPVKDILEEDDDDDVDEEDTDQDPLIEMAGWKFLLTMKDEDFSAEKKAEVKGLLMKAIREFNMAPYYEWICKQLNWDEDTQLTATMKAENDKQLKDLDERERDAKENHGDTEVREAKLARADYYARIGAKKLALDHYLQTMEKTVGSGLQIDILFSIIRVGLSYTDNPLVKQYITKAKAAVEKGGDWERRNLLAVYESTYNILTREFKGAATKLLDAISTFTCYKLFSYNTLVFYAVLTAVVSLDRVTLRKRVIKNPEILSIINDIPHLKSFLFSLYNCKYGEFFNALAGLTRLIKRDPYLAPHFGYFMREIRIVAYSQFLESYRSVTVQSMAASFGVSQAFLDKELSRFISAGRLNCKIDKVGGQVETNRPDAKNAQYSETIKKGDLLLNRIQKLTRVINA